MASKQTKLVVRLTLFAILAGLIGILGWRLLTPSTIQVENATSVELADVELRFTVAGKPVSYKLGVLLPREKRLVTLDLGSGDFPFVASYGVGPQKVDCDPGVTIKGRGEHVIFRISPDKYEIVPE